MAKAEQFSVVIAAIDKASTPVRMIADKVEALGKITERAAAPWRRLAEPMRAIGARVAELAPMLGALGSALSVSGLAELTVGAAESAEQLYLLAQRAGMTTQAVQELEYAARLSAVPAQALTRSLAQFQTVVAQVGGGQNKMAAAYFREMGVNLKDAHGKALPMIDVMKELATVFHKNAGNPAAVNSLMLVTKTLFGMRSGVAMFNFLAQGPDKIAKQMHESDVVQGRRSDGAISRGRAFADSWKKLQAAVGGVTTAIGDSLTGPLKPVVDNLTTLAEESRKWIKAHLPEYASDFAKSLNAVNVTNVLAAFRAVRAVFAKTIADLERIGALIDAVTHPTAAVLGRLGIQQNRFSVQQRPLIGPGSVNDPTSGMRRQAILGTRAIATGSGEGGALSRFDPLSWWHEAEGMLSSRSTRSEIRVRFENAPGNLRVDSSTTGGPAPDIGVSYATDFGGAWGSVLP